MVYETNIRLKHHDPKTLSEDLRAVTELLERRNNERRDATTPTAENALRAAEGLLGNR